MSEKETISRQTFFVKKWVEHPELNIWLNEVKGDAVNTKCKVCRTVFKLSAVGKSASKDHSDWKSISLKSRK